MQSSAPQSASEGAPTASVSVDDGTVAAVSGDSTRSEVAAIAAAIAARRVERTRLAAQAAAGDVGWTGRRWTFAGRIDRLQDQDARPTDGTPTDPWTAAGRTQRMK